MNEIGETKDTRRRRYRYKPAMMTFRKDKSLEVQEE